jgi:hypothetical protein
VNAQRVAVGCSVWLGLFDVSPFLDCHNFSGRVSANFARQTLDVKTLVGINGANTQGIAIQAVKMVCRFICVVNHAIFRLRVKIRLTSSARCTTTENPSVRFH